MKTLVLLPIVLLLLLSGCMNMKTAEDCEAITPDEVLQSTSWGENFVSTDDSVVAKARFTCWHTAALGYVAQRDELSAIDSCEAMLLVPETDEDTAYREYALCIDAVAKRVEDPGICGRITNEDFLFEQKRCEEHAEPKEAICVLSPFALLALGAIFMLRKG